MDPGTVVAAVERHRSLFNARDRSGWLANMVEDVTLEEPVGSAVRHGREAFGAVFDAVYAHDEQASIPPFDDMVVSGNEVASYLRGAPRGGGAAPGIVEIFRIADDGRLAAARVFIDARRLPA